MTALKGRALVLLVVMVTSSIFLASSISVNGAVQQTYQEVAPQGQFTSHRMTSGVYQSLDTIREASLASASRQRSISFSTSNPGSVFGIDSDAHTSYPDIPWLRLNYPTCGWGNLAGQVLKDTIQSYHDQGIRILLVICQWSKDSSLLDPNRFNDAAQGGADAVQCGNEQMKNDPPYTRYVSPDLYAKFFDLCQRAVHAVNPNAATLLGSLDPQIVTTPINPAITNQVNYLNAMQTAMNTQVYKGGNWDWRTQTIGLIDSWHNSYPDPDENNLYQLFVFWGEQFGIDPDSGQLGEHIWVSEGTGCFKGCGLDTSNAYQPAVAHIMTLISDVKTSISYQVPFFFFSGKDFLSGGIYWPIGILDINGNPKPLRQDLPMGSRTLKMSCSSGKQRVEDQEQLLATLYAGCRLPKKYVSILER